QHIIAVLLYNTMHLNYNPYHLYTSSQLFPYTTLFRSVVPVVIAELDGIAKRVKLVFALPYPGTCWRQIVLMPLAVGCDIEGNRSDRKSTRLNSSHQIISYAVFCLKKKNNIFIMQFAYI